MLKVWREDEGEASSRTFDLGDPESAALRFAEEDVDDERAYWVTHPVVVVQDETGTRTRFEIEAVTDFLATPLSPSPTEEAETS